MLRWVTLAFQITGYLGCSSVSNHGCDEDQRLNLTVNPRWNGRIHYCMCSHVWGSSSKSNNSKSKLNHFTSFNHPRIKTQTSQSHVTTITQQSLWHRHRQETENKRPTWTSRTPRFSRIVQGEEISMAFLHRSRGLSEIQRSSQQGVHQRHNGSANAGPGQTRSNHFGVSVVPSGKPTKNGGKSPFWMGKSTVNGPCSIAMLVYRMVCLHKKTTKHWQKKHQQKTSTSWKPQEKW